MIASVRGRVLDLRLDAVVVEVGGVGLLAYATPATLAGLRIGQEAALATSLVVREDAHLRPLDLRPAPSPLRPLAPPRISQSTAAL